MLDPTIAIIGAGHMGGSLIRGLIKQGHAPQAIWASDHHAEKLASLEKAFSICTTKDNSKALECADIVIFAIKPQQFSQAAADLSAAIQAKNMLIVSIMTGIKEAQIQQYLGGKQAIIRAMPNIAVANSQGATALYANSLVNMQQLSMAQSIFKAVGSVVLLDKEDQLDTVTALSGSGPAYFFFMMQALQEGAEQLGLRPEIAKQLTIQTAMGAAYMAKDNDVSLEELRRRVTSSGGTTEKAISVLENNHLCEILQNALKAAKDRAQELATLLNKDK
jgi:pyrroline-5-carboxylate reductase